jgi:hypothetical protein
LVERTAARKRLLHARYMGWATGVGGSRGLFGPGGEMVVHKALTAAAPYGYRLVNPSSGETSTLLGARVVGGALDNAAFLTPMDVTTNAPTGASYLVVVEVKNVRHWLYPRHWEIHQLLHKAAVLQTDNPDTAVLPVLVCRRAQATTFNMAADLGFHIIQTKQQFVRMSAEVVAERLDEVRDELYYRDLVMTDTPPAAMVRHFTTLVPAQAERMTDRWSAVASELADTFQVLRDRSLDNQQRDRALFVLREGAKGVLDHQLGAWGAAA